MSVATSQENLWLYSFPSHSTAAVWVSPITPHLGACCWPAMSQQQLLVEAQVPCGKLPSGTAAVHSGHDDSDSRHHL